MRPANTQGSKWIINRESYHPTKTSAVSILKSSKPKLPHTVENVGRTRTPFGTYRRDTWRVRTFIPRVFKGTPVKTAPMTKARAAEVSKFHPDKKLVNIQGAYYYL